MSGFLWRAAPAPSPTTFRGAAAATYSGLLLVLLGAVALLQANVAAQWWPQGQPAPTSMADDDEFFAALLGMVATVSLCVVLAVGCARRKEVLCACLWTTALILLLASPTGITVLATSLGTPFSASFVAGYSMLGVGGDILLLAQALTVGRGVVGRSALNSLAVVAYAALAMHSNVVNRVLAMLATSVGMAPSSLFSVGDQLANRMLGTHAPSDIFLRAPVAVAACFWGLHLVWRGSVGSLLALRRERRQPAPQPSLRS